MSSIVVTRVLLVEDNPTYAKLVVALLKEAEPGRVDVSTLNRFHVTIAGRLDMAINIARDTPPDAVLLDLSLPDSSGMETIRSFMQAAPDVPIIVLTGQEDSEIGIQALNEGCQDYLSKGDSDGKTISRTIIHSIRRKQLESMLAIKNRQLEEAKREADSANLSKTRFLAAASHDLRQPLQAIAMFLEVLSGHQKTPETWKLVEKIEDSLDALAALLNELLDISKMDAGAIRPKIESFSIGELMMRLDDEIAPMAVAKGLIYKTEPTNAFVLSDPIMLESILRNILGNAVKYTDKGRIVCAVKKRGLSLCIEVWDTGMGIPRDQLEAIFDDFHQVGNVNRDRRNGVGLGLSIVKRTAQLLGHKVEVSSFLGGGSIFSVMVPLAEDDALHREQSRPEIGSVSALVLAFEDDLDILDGLRMFLESRGHRVIAKICNVDLCDACKEMGVTLAAEGQVPDLIISDNGLHKDCSGLTIVQGLRAQLGQKIPAIILTGNTGSELIEKATGNNVSVIYKPIRANELDMAIENALLSQNSPVSQVLQ